LVERPVDEPVVVESDLVERVLVEGEGRLIHRGDSNGSVCPQRLKLNERSSKFDAMDGEPTGTTAPTRERIVEAALRLFSERGTSAVSVRELADAADVTVPGLYYHFESKAAVVREVYRARFGVDATPTPALRVLPP